MKFEDNVYLMEEGGDVIDGGDTLEIDASLLEKIDEYVLNSQNLMTKLSSTDDLILRRGKKISSLDGIVTPINSSSLSQVQVVSNLASSLLDYSSSSDADNTPDEEDEDECIICSESLHSNEISEIGVLDDCGHVFCFKCIKAWSDRASVCPLCKGKFGYIRKLRWGHVEDLLNSGSVRRKLKRVRKTKSKGLRRLVSKNNKWFMSLPSNIIEVEEKTLQDEFTQDSTGCEICGNDNNWDQLLLCDGCDHGFHTYCLQPPLTSIPEGDWFCTSCLQPQRRRINRNNGRREITRSRTHHRSVSDHGNSSTILRRSSTTSFVDDEHDNSEEVNLFSVRPLRERRSSPSSNNILESSDSDSTSLFDRNDSLYDPEDISNLNISRTTPRIKKTTKRKKRKKKTMKDNNSNKRKRRKKKKNKSTSRSTSSSKLTKPLVNNILHSPLRERLKEREVLAKTIAQDISNSLRRTSAYPAHAESSFSHTPSRGSKAGRRDGLLEDKGVSSAVSGAPFPAFNHPATFSFASSIQPARSEIDHLIQESIKSITRRLNESARKESKLEKPEAKLKRAMATAKLERKLKQENLFDDTYGTSCSFNTENIQNTDKNKITLANDSPQNFNSLASPGGFPSRSHQITSEDVLDNPASSGNISENPEGANMRSVNRREEIRCVSKPRDVKGDDLSSLTGMSPVRLGNRIASSPLITSLSVPSRGNFNDLTPYRAVSSDPPSITPRRDSLTLRNNVQISSVLDGLSRKDIDNLFNTATEKVDTGTEGSNNRYDLDDNKSIYRPVDIKNKFTFTYRYQTLMQQKEGKQSNTFDNNRKPQINGHTVKYLF